MAPPTKIVKSAWRCGARDTSDRFEESRSAEAGEGDVDGHQTGRRHPQDPKRVNQQGERRTRQKSKSGDQPDGPSDVPAMGRHDAGPCSEAHGDRLQEAVAMKIIPASDRPRAATRTDAAGGQFARECG